MLYCKTELSEVQTKQEHWRILIIEDSAPINKALALELQKHGCYSVDGVTTFESALQALSLRSYDFVILDLNLPDAFGEDLVDDIQRKSDAKIIVLTSEIDAQVRENLFKRKIVDYIVKDKTFTYSLRSIHPIIQSLHDNKEITILVIDDSKFVCQQLRSLLHVRNYKVEVALSASEAVAILGRQEINTIILDMELPDKHGLEFLREIKAEDDFCHIPVIVLSGSNDPETVRNALKAGASDFVKKPFNIEEMMLKVDLSVEMNKKYTQALCTQRMLKEYKEAIDSSALVSKTDPRGIITYANETFAKLSGYKVEELIGKPHSIVRHPDMPKEVFRDMWQTIQSKRVWQGKVKNRKKNGDSYYVKTTIKPILDASEQIVEYIAIRTDITTEETYKEILEKDLQVANNNMYYLSQIEDAMQRFVAVVKTNTRGTIIYTNENFQKISGYTHNELLGKRCSSLRHQKHIKDNDCERISEELSLGNPVHHLFTNLKKDGSLFYTDTTIYPLIDHKGKVQEHLHLMYDVTDLVEIHNELEKTQKDIIYTMGEIGESRSQETGNHVKRVAYYSKLLAELLGEDAKYSDLLFTASPMHDIGKVAIPDAILKKPGRLDDYEFEIMKRHATIGYEVLKNSNRSILQTAALIAYTHHEKWDGSGYPRGLKEDEIPLCGRITAVADVFDALGSDRAYKKAWPLEKILSFFKKQRGKHFDPRLVDLFLENLDSFLKIRERFRD